MAVEVMAARVMQVATVVSAVLVERTASLVRTVMEAPEATAAQLAVLAVGRRPGSRGDRLPRYSD